VSLNLFIGHRTLEVFQLLEPELNVKHKSRKSGLEIKRNNFNGKMFAVTGICGSFAKDVSRVESCFV
jgi:hypothetical protein